MKVAKNEGRRVIEYFRPEAGRVAGAIALLGGSVLLNVLKPWPLAVIVDSVLGGKPFPAALRGLGRAPRFTQLAALCGAIFVLHFLQAAATAGQNYVSIQAGLRGLQRVRRAVFERLQRLSLRVWQGSSMGDLIYRASWDAYSFQTLFQQGLMTVVTASLSLVVMLGIMTRVDVPLTLVAVGLAPLLVVAMQVFGRGMRERTTAAQQADSQVTALVQQNLTALPLIQSETRERIEGENFRAATETAQQRRLAQHGSELWYGFAVALVFAVGTMATTFVGAMEVSAHRMTVGELFVFLVYLAQLYEPLNQLSHAGATVAGATAGTRRVFEIMDMPAEVAEPEKPRVCAERPGIGLRGVTFAYEKGREVLRGVTLAVAPGEAAALIGPSGAGKTTLLQLLPRFFDPVAGVVEIGGTDTRELSLADLRRHIALVLQEPIILPGTVAENISCAKPDATAEEMAAAARAANAENFIAKLPEGYETRIGEGGARLSAGERQRISLARAFLKNAPIVLLDEPTSALDAESERLITESLGRLLPGRAALLVAHRPATLACVTRVIVLQEGCVTEDGAPEELRRSGGYYARTFGAGR